MDADEYTTKIGYTLEDLAREGRSLLLSLFLKQPEEWFDLPQNTKVRWIERVAEPLSFRVSQEIGTTWEALAASLYMQFYNRTEAEFVQESRYIRLAWQAVARHLINLLTCEDEDDVRSLGRDTDAHWKEWLHNKLKEKESKSGEITPPEED